MFDAPLFLACLITVAASPSFVASVPLPPPSSTLQRHKALPFIPFVHHRRSAPLPSRRASVLRIVEDEQDRLEPASWTRSFTEEFEVEQSIFSSETTLEAVLDHVHVPHGEVNSMSRKTKRSKVTAEQGHSQAKRTRHRGTDRSLDKRMSSRWLAGQAERVSRQAAEASASRHAAAAADPTSTTAIWSKVQATATPTPTLPSSASSTLFGAATQSLTAAPTTTITTSAPAATPTVQLEGTHTGEGTWFAPGLGACGTVATDDSAIVAVSHLLYDNYPGATLNPNLNPICGQKIRATYQGNSVEVTVQDRCVGCAIDDLDFSPAMFGELADLAIGRLKGVEWTFI
ncbi:hypothetical protein JCM10212_004204 [Sporobolomyces blumeae]